MDAAFPGEGNNWRPPTELNFEKSFPKTIESATRTSAGRPYLRNSQTRRETDRIAIYPASSEAEPCDRSNVWLSR